MSERLLKAYQKKYDKELEEKIREFQKAQKRHLKLKYIRIAK
jgi:hypothetical protein